MTFTGVFPFEPWLGACTGGLGEERLQENLQRRNRCPAGQMGEKASVSLLPKEGQAPLGSHAVT